MLTKPTLAATNWLVAEYDFTPIRPSWEGGIMEEISGNVAYFVIGGIGIFFLVGILYAVAKRSANLLATVVGISLIAVLLVGNATDLFNSVGNGPAIEAGE